MQILHSTRSSRDDHAALRKLRIATTLHQLGRHRVDISLLLPTPPRTDADAAMAKIVPPMNFGLVEEGAYAPWLR
jgi:hypothetical protein